MCRREWLCLLLSHAADFRDGRRVSQPGLAATDDPGRTMAVVSRVNRVPRRQRTVSFSVVMLLMAGIAAVASRVGFGESPPPPAPLLLMLATASAPATPLPRPPYGRVDARVVERLGSRGLTTALWDVDPRDWSRPGAGTIAARVLDRLHPGAVIVLHDGGGDRSQTVAALPVILDGIRSRGYVPAPLCA